jgi:integrase
LIVRTLRAGIGTGTLVNLVLLRVRAGIAQARRAGKRLGRPPLRVLKPKDVAELRKERAGTKAPFRLLATKYGISVFTAYTLCAKRSLRGRTWWISYSVGGRQKFESSRSSRKADAQELPDIRRGDARAGRLRLIKRNPPRRDEYARRFLLTVRHPNTQKRYRSSVHNFSACFGNVKISDITADAIEGFKEERLSQGIRTATINRDLALLRLMMKRAERRRLINESPFREVDFLEEIVQRRRPHILTFEEEDRVLAAAAPHIRALAVLILETGMRSRREALSLLWSDVDFVNGVIHVRESKTKAGERNIPISDRCNTELLRWRSLVGPKLSSYVFPNMHDPSKPLKDLRRSWAKALKDAGLQYFWLYDLRHTLASRLTQAGVSPVFVAQIIGHSSASILSTYARAIDEYRRDAIHKLEDLRDSHVSTQKPQQIPPSGSVQ